MMKIADKVKTATINSFYMFKKIEKKHKNDEERNERCKKKKKKKVQMKYVET